MLWILSCNTKITISQLQNHIIWFSRLICSYSITTIKHPTKHTSSQYYNYTKNYFLRNDNNRKKYLRTIFTIWFFYFCFKFSPVQLLFEYWIKLLISIKLKKVINGAPLLQSLNYLNFLSNFTSIQMNCLSWSLLNWPRFFRHKLNAHFRDMFRKCRCKSELLPDKFDWRNSIGVFRVILVTTKFNHNGLTFGRPFAWSHCSKWSRNGSDLNTDVTSTLLVWN